MLCAEENKNKASSRAPYNVMSKNKQYSALKLRPVFSRTHQNVFTFTLLELTQMVREVLNTAQHKSVQGT